MLIFYAGLRGLGSNNFQNSSYKQKTTGSARVSRLSVSYDYGIIKPLACQRFFVSFRIDNFIVPFVTKRKLYRDPVDKTSL